MSGNPTTPPMPSNVVPMPTNWPGPMFTPKTWPPGGSPSCFSELAGLNACYDSVQMMEQILAKVMTDLVTNNVAVQQAIVEAIAKSGSNVPLIGVTNGSNAQPGQVGEYVDLVVYPTYPATTVNTQQVSMGVLQPGDWACWANFSPVNFGGGNWFILSNPVGNSTPMVGESLDNAAGLTAYMTVSQPARCSITAPTLIVFQLTTNYSSNAAAASTTGEMRFQAWRMR